MTDLFRFAQVDTTEAQYLRELGKEVVFDATTRYMEQVMGSLAVSRQLFVEEVTTTFQEKYTLPMGGEMEQVAHGTEFENVDVLGSWDTAYPVYKFGTQVAMNKEEFSYMTPAQYGKLVNGVISRYATRQRKDIMRAIFNNSTRTFTDFNKGTLTIQPLANSTVDSVEYPPEVGSDVGASRTVDAYVGTAYAAGAISNTNDPIETIETYYEATYGYFTGGSPVYAYINKAQAGVIEALNDFRPIPVNLQTLANDTEYASSGVFGNFPNPTGKVLGIVRNTVIIQWEYIPAGYIYSQYMEAEAPLKMRVHDTGTGLGTGGNLQMAIENPNKLFELNSWEAYFGFGVGNRLNGHVIHLSGAGTYTTPTVYAY